MERILMQNKMIENLKQELQQGNSEALQEFWRTIEKKGTPLIEEINGDFQNVSVTFVYKSDKKIDNVVLMPPVGYMNFAENKMDRLLETNLWYASYKVRNDIRFSYFFSINDAFNNDWQRRYKNSTHDIFNKNKIVFTDDNFVQSYALMPEEKEHIWVKEGPEVPKGNLYEYNFHSDNLEEDRRIRIYTPHSYDKDGKSYRFLVLTDGDEYINMLSAVNVLDNLIADKKIPPLVAIFIDSTDTRDEELSCSDVFANIVVKELLPWVKEIYNISSKADEAIIGGLSLGGLEAAYLGLKHSEVFGNVLSQSGSYWYKPENYKGQEKDCWMGLQFEAIDKLSLKFYLNVGVIEAKKMIDTNIKLRDILIRKGYEVHFEEFKSGHDYLSWGETLANGLIALIG